METYKNQEKDLRLLTYKILVETFNNKYTNLNDDQKGLLREFINNVNQTTLIGTLESSDKLKHYIFNSIPCLITEITPTPTPTVGGGKRQFIEDRNHMIDQNRRHVSTRRKQLKGSKLTRKSKKDYRYS